MFNFIKRKNDTKDKEKSLEASRSLNQINLLLAEKNKELEEKKESVEDFIIKIDKFSSDIEDAADEHEAVTSELAKLKHDFSNENVRIAKGRAKSREKYLAKKNKLKKDIVNLAAKKVEMVDGFQATKEEKNNEIKLIDKDILKANEKKGKVVTRVKALENEEKEAKRENKRIKEESNEVAQKTRKMKKKNGIDQARFDELGTDHRSLIDNVVLAKKAKNGLNNEISKLAKEADIRIEKLEYMADEAEKIEQDKFAIAKTKEDIKLATKFIKGVYAKANVKFPEQVGQIIK